MFLKKNKKKKFIIIFLTLIIIFFSLYQIQSVRLGNIDQELRIIFKQPVLFSTYNSIEKNLDHLLYASKNFFKKKKLKKKK